MSAFQGTLEQTVILATPLLIASLGENVVQTSGVVNVGLEGMMLCGALGATIVTLDTHNPFFGLAAGAGCGAALALLFGVFTVWLAANQVVVGVVMNLLALGLTGTIYQAQFGQTGAMVQTESLPRVIGQQTVLLPLALILVPGVWWWLSRTRRGLELRACGEQPVAAEASGVNVRGTRIQAVLFGGIMAGIAGACLSIGNNNTFVPMMTDGRGFIALAIVTSGRWSPWGCLIASLIFGFTDALQFSGQALGIHIAKDLFLAFPYVATIVILSIGGKYAPAPHALGKPYRRA